MTAFFSDSPKPAIHEQNSGISNSTGILNQLHKKIVSHMKNFTKILLFLFTLSSLASLHGQALVSSTFVGSRTKDQINAQFGFNPYVLNGVNMYKITYTTPDVHGVPDTASGLVIVPDNLSKIYPLLSFSHGTVGAKTDVPSNLQGGYELPMVISGTGFVVAAADYLGLGDSRGFHPYVHADSEASASVDMLFAVREFAEQNGIFLNDQLFLTGYSQGGHAALATQRLLQESYADEFTITASSPMSGPYEIYGAQSGFALGDEEFFYPGFLPYVALGYQEAYGNVYGTLEEFFKPGFVPMIEDFHNGNINLTNLNIQLILKLNTDFGMVLPKLMLQDSIADQIINNPNHPVSLLLAANNLTEGWVPQAPTRLPYCGMDDQVHFTNSTNAADAFIANGAPDLEAVLINPDYDHGQCVVPATTFTILFFRQYQMIDDVNASTTAEGLRLNVFPNPASDFLTISGLEHAARLTLFDVTGKLEKVENIGAGTQSVDVTDLPNGFYFAHIETAGQSWRQKIMIRH
ncbi:MAG: T9SS C-terminal target domain-containing protein [Bacteroidetes bacterium]|nr:MAG: T9SS C-terminal target domain-containing protein [Bacteroidota bacterium]